MTLKKLPPLPPLRYCTAPNRVAVEASPTTVTITMIAQRQIARAAPRFTAQLRAQAQRRFASTETEFARERRHVKEHAGATTGEDFCCPRGQLIAGLTRHQTCGARSPSCMLPASPFQLPLRGFHDVAESGCSGSNEQSEIAKEIWKCKPPQH